MIDISPWINRDSFSDAARETVCRQWYEAFRSVGFAIIVGHGITPDTLTDVTNEACAWFASDIDTKMQYYRGPYGNAGMSAACNSPHLAHS